MQEYSRKGKNKQFQYHVVSDVERPKCYLDNIVVHLGGEEFQKTWNDLYIVTWKMRR